MQVILCPLFPYVTDLAITTEEVTEGDFMEMSAVLGMADVIANAQSIQNIASSNQIQVINQKIATFKTSKEGYIYYVMDLRTYFILHIL